MEVVEEGVAQLGLVVVPELPGEGQGGGGRGWEGQAPGGDEGEGGYRVQNNDCSPTTAAHNLISV